MTNEGRTTMTNEGRPIASEEQARAFVREMAQAYQPHYNKDMDALLELGDADMDTILEGYLWDRMLDHLDQKGIDVDEDTEELLSCAIVDFYIDMLDC